MTATSPPPDVCPACSASLHGHAVQPYAAGFYDFTHYTRAIALFVQDERTPEATAFWACPDCGHKWPRDPNDTIRP